MSIRIMVSPESAAKAGARWCISDDGVKAGKWLASGEVVSDLEARQYCIEFAPIAGWKTPQALTVRNVEGFANCKTVAYTPLSVFVFGQIPPQTAWHGQQLEFMIPLEEARISEVHCEPKPAGMVALDKDSGIFRYQPGGEDKFPFTVTLTSKAGKRKQTFEVTPMPILRPEVDVFSDILEKQDAVPVPVEVVSRGIEVPLVGVEMGEKDAPEVPEPFSMVAPHTNAGLPITGPGVRAGAFIPLTPAAAGEITEEAVVDTVENAPEPFNHEVRVTKNIRIITEYLVLEKGSRPYDTLHDDPAIRKLEIYAETVTIRDPLHLPQTDVSIFARELRFEDHDGASSSLCTTPLDFTTSAESARREPDLDAKGQIKKNAAGQELFKIILPHNGEPGLKGGDVSLHIETFKAASGARKHLVLAGGRGQEPGAGLNGLDGAKLPEKTEYYQANIGTTSSWKIVYGIHYAKSSGFVTTEHIPWGVQAWPTNGEDPTRAGIPGQGGDGGTLTSTLDLDAQVDVAGGIPGLAGAARQGGAGGTPKFALMVESWNKHEEPFGGHYWGWNYLAWPGWNYHKILSGGSQYWGYISQPGGFAPETYGEAGVTGKISREGHPLSWLHPLLLGEILKRVKHSYLLGNFDKALEKLVVYAGLLDIYQLMDVWRQLEDVQRLELISIRSEMAGLIARLNSHLDYFGNPAGWVPMLSFEVNRTLFDNEIDRSIDILYLTYWLREKAKDDTQRVAALGQMENKLKQEIEELKSKFKEATEAFPGLDMEAGNISNDINLIQVKLKTLVDELRRKATQQLEDPWWKTGLKLAGTLLTVVPVYQPALGAVGGLMKLGADFDQDDPWKTITGAADIAASYAGARVTQKKEAYETSLKKVDTNSKEFKALESAKNLSDATTALSKGLEGFSQVLAERQAPQSEVDALLQKLKAESKEFQQLSDEISALLARKMEFAQKITATLQLVSEVPDIITNNLLAIDSARAVMATGENVLRDGRLTMHLETMDRRAKERLLKYHYYLAKSYQYRLLQPFPGTLDIDKVFDKMKQLAELNLQDEKPYVLTKDQFDSLKSIYRDMLASVSDKILDIYQENPPEFSAPRRFSLTPAEIKRLNAGETITLNLVDQGLFKLSEENVRIVDLEVEGITLGMLRQAERQLMEVDLRIEHSGISQLRSAGRAISFRHPARETTNPITWVARYDVIDKKIDSIRPSPDSDSLLRSLLKSDTADTMMLYSRPSAWADLKVSREVTDGSEKPVIKTVRLKVSYDFTRRVPGTVVLHVKAVPQIATVSATLRPYFALDREDITGRADGRGTFYRAYQGGGIVEIRAQERYGKWRFHSWVNQVGTLLGMNTTLKVKTTADLVIRAVYRFAG